MGKSFGTVVFSHGKESGPWGSKITAMAAVVRELGAAVIDRRHVDRAQNPMRYVGRSGDL